MPKQKMHILKFIVLTFLIGGVLSGATIAILLYTDLIPQQFIGDSSNSTGKSAQTEQESFVYEPKGYLLMNLAPGGSESKEFYIYNVANGELKQSNLGYVWPHESSDGKIGIGSKLFSQEGQIVPGIFSVNGNGEKLIYASSTQEVLFANPKLSPSGKRYTFAVAPVLEKMVTHEQRYTPSEWRIYLGETDGEGDPRYVANGPVAVFSSDETQLLYLGDDGFHTYEIATGKDSLVSELKTEQKLTYVMADISSDGKKLAITSSPTKEVKVADILSWDPFTIEWTHTFPILAYWPAFSPDGNYLALMQFDWVDGHPGNRRATIIDLHSEQSYDLGGLEKYTSSGFYISDWTN